MKKTLAILLTAMMIIGLFVTVPISASAYAVPSESDFVSKLNQLRSKYPNGGTWSGTYYEGSEPKAWQCMGYAHQMLYEVFGARFYADGLYNQKNYTMGALNAGDEVRINSDNHSIFITKVTSDRYYFTDANWDYKNGIRWDASYSKAEMASKFTYKVHISGNNLTGNGTPAVLDKEPPIITGGYISEVTDSGFRVCFQATDNIGIASAKVATWATGDQSDLVWHDCRYNGSGTYFVDLKRTDCAPGATYYVSHAFVYDAAGNQASKEFTQSYGEGYSVVNSIYFSQIKRETFRICCEVNDISNIESVRVATWATGDQSDIKWTGCFFNGETTYFAELNRNDYAKGVKFYICHVYIKFKSEKEQSFEKTITYDDTPPVISDLNVDYISENGFWVSCKVEDTSRIKSVQFPTWLASDPKQSDIKWHEATINDGLASCFIPMSEHNNKIDTYYVHVYAYDSFENFGTARITVDMKAEIEKQQNPTEEPSTDKPAEPNSSENQATQTIEPTESTSDKPTETTETQFVTDTPTEPIETQPVTDKPAEPTQPVTDNPTEPVETQHLKTNISNWNVSGIKSMTFTGKVLKQDNILVSKDGEYADFSVKYKNNVNVGAATVTITGTGEYIGTIVKTFKITKAENTVKVTAKRTVKSKAKKKTTIKKAITVKNAQGKVTYKTNNKKVKVKNGKLIVAKGFKKGKTIKVKVTITAKGNRNYKMKKIVKTIRIRVK